MGSFSFVLPVFKGLNTIGHGVSDFKRKPEHPKSEPVLIEIRALVLRLEKKGLDPAYCE